MGAGPAPRAPRHSADELRQVVTAAEPQTEHRRRTSIEGSEQGGQRDGDIGILCPELVDECAPEIGGRIAQRAALIRVDDPHPLGAVRQVLSNLRVWRLPQEGRCLFARLPDEEKPLPCPPPER